MDDSATGTNGKSGAQEVTDSFFNEAHGDFDDLFSGENQDCLMDRCFHFFQSDEDKEMEEEAEKEKDQEIERGIHFQGFKRLMQHLFWDMDQGRPFYIPELWFSELFTRFDKDGDGLLTRTEFKDMFYSWIQVIMRPKAAFIIVDVQNDFISGSLSIVKCAAGHRGEEVVPVINRMVQEVPFDLIVYSYDWHPENHISFYENIRKRKIFKRGEEPFDSKREPDGDDPILKIDLFETVTFEGPPEMVQKLWPRHCVQNTWGSQLHDNLDRGEGKNTFNVYKGTNPEVDSYSAFWDNNKLSETNLANKLKQEGITDVYVCGIAYDVCVGATANHANEYGFRTSLVNNASRGVDLKNISDIKNMLINQNVAIIESEKVKMMVQGKERRPEHGYHLASFL